MHGKPYSMLWILTASVVALAPIAAVADNFGNVRYDKQSARLSITMLYRGTNPNHNFSLNWDACQTDPNDNESAVTAEVLDDQFDDAAEQDFKKTFVVSLRDMPCPRPVKLTLRTAPRFFYTLTIP
ncbi:MAG: hypothetical protein M3O26_14180 [Pseudomonadota bacterium]|nr:hypothetical protein [Pseudomonadota bacterium]